MRNSSDLFQPVLQNLATQIQLNEQQLCKVESDIQPVVCQRKVLQQSEVTNIRKYCFERMANNMWFCKELGQTIPSTPQGKPDMERLAHEIASHQDFFQLM